MTQSEFPQIKIRDVYFGSEGGVPFANAEVEIIFSETGASVLSRLGVKHDDDDTVTELKRKLLEMLHQRVAQAASIGFEQYPALLTEGMKSYLDRPWQNGLEEPES